jgi:hypothetical protein
LGDNVNESNLIVQTGLDRDPATKNLWVLWLILALLVLGAVLQP